MRSGVENNGRDAEIQMESQTDSQNRIRQRQNRDAERRETETERRQPARRAREKQINTQRGKTNLSIYLPQAYGYVRIARM